MKFIDLVNMNSISILNIFLTIHMALHALLLSKSLEDTSKPYAGFSRGSLIIFQDNFDKDALGNFTALWTTTRSGEVKKLKGFENKCNRLLPQSNEVIIQINEVSELENAIKRMITGHTESDGEDKANILINTIIKV